MSGGCGRQYCTKCHEELIHRDHRKFYESSSGLGQIVHRDMTRAFGVADIDLAVERTRQNACLLRFVEQKQATHNLGDSQEQILGRLAELIAHVHKSPDFRFSDGATLAPESGVVMLYAEIIPALRDGDRRQRLELPPRFIVRPLLSDEHEIRPREFLLGLVSTKAERKRGIPWLVREFIKREAQNGYSHE